MTEKLSLNTRKFQNAMKVIEQKNWDKRTKNLFLQWADKNSTSLKEIKTHLK